MMEIFIDVLIVKIKIIVTSFDGRLWIDIFDFCQRFWCCLLSCCGVVLLRCCGVRIWEETANAVLKRQRGEIFSGCL